MRSSGIVEIEITADGGAGVADRLVNSKIDLLVFDRAPQPFDKDVVAPGALAVHADSDGVLDQRAGEGRAGELAALIGVEDIRRAVACQGLFQRLDAESSLHRDRQAIAEDPAAEPVDDSGEVDEAAPIYRWDLISSAECANVLCHLNIGWKPTHQFRCADIYRLNIFTKGGPA